MSALRCFERMIYKQIDNKDIVYPLIDEDNFTCMAVEASLDSSEVICFLYLRSGSERSYLDFYVWDIMLPKGYERFVIEPGYALTEDSEEMFLKYLHEDVFIDSTKFENCIRRVTEEYPEIHLQHYTDWRQTLMHVYFTFHRTGPHEILFKANLNYLAAGLSYIDEYNLIGSTPEKIFDVQQGMLRAMNSPFGAETLKSVGNREWARYLYARYHNLIHGSVINKYQWLYMKKQTERNEAIMDKRMYQFLGNLSSDEYYACFLKYREQKKVVDGYYSSLPQYPKENEYFEIFELCDSIKHYIEREEEIDKHLQSRVRQYGDRYSYETEDYIVLMVSSLRELLSEAENQHNCLVNYIYRVAYGNTIILFMREKGRENEALITIEVENGEIRQALRAHNRKPNEKQRRFLEEYALLKKLIL